MNEQPFRLGYVPALDGLRAVAVLGVMSAHIGQLTPPGDFAPPFLPAGGLGVDVFFTLSGFLITSLLVQEWRETGRISIAQFYWRRTLRLLPALALLLLACVAFVLVAYPLPLARRTLAELPYTLLYIQNWARAFDLFDWGLLPHTWSLSIEEQFYLLAAPTFALLLRSGATLRGMFLGTLALLLASALFRSLLIWSMEGGHAYYNSLARADSILIGCALALYLAATPAARREGITRTASRLAPVGAVGIGLMMLCPVPVTPLLLARIAPTAMCTAVVIAGLATGRLPVVTRLLASPPLVAIGGISYGLYLWHGPIYQVLGLVDTGLGWPVMALVGTVLTVAVSAVSHRFIETPALRQKRRLIP